MKHLKLLLILLIIGQGAQGGLFLGLLEVVPYIGPLVSTVKKVVGIVKEISAETEPDKMLDNQHKILGSVLGISKEISQMDDKITRNQDEINHNFHEISIQLNRTDERIMRNQRKIMDSFNLISMG